MDVDVNVEMDSIGLDLIGLDWTWAGLNSVKSQCFNVDAQSTPYSIYSVVLCTLLVFGMEY